VKISSGTLIILNNSKVLLCHPSNSGWDNTFTPAKGGVEPSESIIDAAIRETMEEISISINKELISGKDPIEILYKNKKGKVYKKVYLFKINISSVSEIGLTSEILDKSMLQLQEIDWAGFITKKEAKKKIFKKMDIILEHIN